MEIKNDLSTEVRALTKRMTHIDTQIGQIFNFLSPIKTSETHNSTSISKTASPLPSQNPSPPLSQPLSPLNTVILPETTVSSVSMSPLSEAPSFYSDLNAKMTIFNASHPVTTTTAATTPTDVHDPPRQSRTNEQIIETPPIREISDYDTTTLSVPPPPSIYNRSASSSVISLGASTPSRSSISNKIAPAPAPPSPKHPLNTTFQPISNTRFNPGRSPKPKARLHHSRTTNKYQQEYPEKSTIIDIEPSPQQDVSNKNVPLLSTPGKNTLTTKPSGNVFRRFMASGSSTEKSVITSSSTLLYPPTSDDERPTSPGSSGNDDDDYRPLTSSSKHHHQTPL
jgi:hypothetical protein